MNESNSIILIDNIDRILSMITRFILIFSNHL